MIRINLLKPSPVAETPALSGMALPLRKFNRYGVLISLCIAASLIIGFALYLRVKNRSSGKAISEPGLEKNLQAAQHSVENGPTPVDTGNFSKPEFKPKVVLSYAVEEIVKEIESEHREKVRHTTYSEFSPSAKIQYHNAVSRKALALIKDNTPSGVGFTDIIVSSPGDLYVRGLAGSNEIYREFISKMNSAALVKIKPGIIKATGPRSHSREFSLYGTFSLGKSGTGGDRVTRKIKIDEVITALKNSAQASGLILDPVNLKSETNAGVYKRLIYQTHVERCNFIQFQNFVNKLHVSGSKVGLLKFSLRSNGTERMSATLDLVIYSH